MAARKPDPGTEGEVPRRADAVRNRERVIKAAEEVFSERGIEAGIPEVVERAGVGKGTVYRNFETKDDLVSAVLAARLERFNELTADALGQEDAWVAFRELLREAVQGKLRRGYFIIGLNHRGTSEALEAARSESRSRLGKLMGKAIEQGRMREDATPEDVSVLFGGICRVLSDQETEDPEVWLRHADQVADALRVQPD